MANTWTAAYLDVAVGLANKSMADLWNPTGSGRILKVYRIWCLNNYRAGAVGGGLNIYQIARITAKSVAGTPVTPTRHDTTLENWAATSCTTHYASTVTEGDVLRRFSNSSDELAIRAVTNIDNWSSLPTLSIQWDTGGYDGAILQPIVIRENTGIHIKFVSGTASVGTLTTVIQFTSE